MNNSFSPPAHDSTPDRTTEARSASESTGWADPWTRMLLVDLESHLGLRVRYPGAQILSHRAVLPGPEHDGPLKQRIVDRQHSWPETARIPDPAHATR